MCQRLWEEPCDAVTVGADSDEHDCYKSAGYSWCDAEAKCYRSWEESCNAAMYGADSDENGAWRLGATGGARRRPSAPAVGGVVRGDDGGDWDAHEYRVAAGGGAQGGVHRASLTRHGWALPWRSWRWCSSWCWASSTLKPIWAPSRW